MTIGKELPIPGVFLLEPTIHQDDRGFFLEIFRQDKLGTAFLQANHSHSVKGVVRGLHYHKRQYDAWYVISGEAQVALADVREKASRPRAETLILRESTPQVLLIPPGVAHGFAALSDLDLIYWVSQYYDSTDEFGIAWDDPVLEIPWRVHDPKLSDRDLENPRLDWDSLSAFS